MRLWFSSISRCSPYITGNKVSVTFRIIMSRTKTDQVLENLKNNPYFDKYAKKIAELQQINPDLLKERIEEEEKKVQKRKEKQEEERSIYRAKAKSEVIEGSHTKEVRLSDIMNMEMIKGKAKEEIEEIWTEYHKQKDYICATMEPEQYERIFDYGKKEFKDSKGIVLMRGEFDLNFLNCQEAQCLANELQLYYTGKSSERLKLMETFNNAPNDFKYNDLISQLEKISFVT